MPSLDTSIKSGFITDLQVPPPGTCGKTTEELTSLSLSVARSLLQDFKAFILSSPLVQSAVEIHPGHPKYIDVATLCSEFGVDPDKTETPPSANIDHANHDPTPNPNPNPNSNPDPSPSKCTWIQYEITDRLPLLFNTTHTTLVYHTAMRRTSSGFESVTTPGNNVRIHGTFSVTQSADDNPGAEDTLTFIEHNETKCNVLLAGYIKATMGSSHREMHERFKAGWNEKMKTRLGEGLRLGGSADAGVGAPAGKVAVGGGGGRRGEIGSKALRVGTAK